jgi:hypothetical protein
VLLWLLLPVWSDVSPSADNVEQLVWSQGLELGYHKHPPMPTWILIGAEQLFAPSLMLTYTLSIAGMLLGAVFLWRLAAELLGRAAALPTVLATGCIAFFSYRAHIYNHNTVLVPFVYASAWLFLRAVRTGGLAYWLALGVASAGGLLTKYQFAVMLVTFLLIALWLNLYRQREFVRGAVLAAGIAGLLLAAHVWWLVRNDFPPMHYASSTVLLRLNAWQRIEGSGGFLLQQVRDSLAAGLMLVLAAMLPWARGAARQTPVSEEPGWPDDRVWIMMLGFAPVALMMALGLVAGVRLENHWGTTALQFVALPLVYWLRERKAMYAPAGLLLTFVVLQAGEVTYAVTGEIHDRNRTLEGGRIRAFDPTALAHAVMGDWRQVTDQPLRFLVGSTTWGGFVSVISPDHPQVLISADPRKSPWVSLAELDKCGAVYFEPMHPPTGTVVSRKGEWVTLDFTNAHRGEPLHIRWSVVSPGPECHTQPSTVLAMSGRTS